MKNKERKKMSPQRGQKRDLMNIAELVIKKRKGILFCVVVLFYFSISRIMELVSYPSLFLNAVCTISQPNRLYEVHGLSTLPGDGKHSMCHRSRSRLVCTEQWVLGAARYPALLTMFDIGLGMTLASSRTLLWHKGSLRVVNFFPAH